jgi:DnaJ-class molecular chaperone
MDQKDYYHVLEIHEHATQQEVKNAFRRLALRYHPDRNKDDPAAASKMKEINESYAVLSDREKRRRYDMLRESYGSSAYDEFRKTYTERDIFRDSDIQQIFEELSRAFGMRGFDDIFRNYYGPEYRTFEFRRAGSFRKVFVDPAREKFSPFSKHQFGGPFGALIKYALKKIWGVELAEKGKDLVDTIIIPPALAQSGGRIRYLCRLRSKELVVTIPPKIRSGQRLRLKGMGGEGKAGGEPGDLYVQIRLRNAFLQKLRDMLNRIWLACVKHRI